MSNKGNDPVSLILFIMLLVVIAIVTSPVWASGTDAEATATSGDIKGSTSIGLAASLGDVDISGCVVTKQIGILVVFQRQDYEYDPYCLADKLDAQKKYADAALMRCTDKETAKLYGERCFDVMNFTPAEGEVLVVAEPVVVYVESEEAEDQHDDRLQQLEDRYDRDRRASAQRAAEEKEYWAEQAEEIREWKSADQ